MAAVPGRWRRRITEALLPKPSFRALSLVAMAQEGHSLLFWVCSGVLACALLLGGGTRGGFLSDAVLDLLAVPVFLIAIARLLRGTGEKRSNNPGLAGAVAVCGAIASIPLIQLVPLPPWIWTHLPHRGEETVLFDLLGRDRPWMPLSMSPTSTWLSALSLLPPAAIFFSAVQLDYHERRGLSLVVLAMGVISAFVGLIQIAQGPSSPLRFFAITNSVDAVGFFANRNHFAAFLYVVLLFASAWAIDGALGMAARHEGDAGPAGITALVASFLILVLLIAVQAMTRSRAGLILMFAALIAAFALAPADRRAASGLTPGRFIVGATALAVVLALQFGLYRMMDRFTADPLQDARLQFAHNTIEAAKAFMPFGAGVGAFVPIYGMFERPQTLLANTYANHAHNDVLEVWLETGALGIIPAGLFVLWIVRKSGIWWRLPCGAQAIDHSLARTGVVAICLLVAHSFVDYPLRTGALESIFAFACALLVAPPDGSANQRKAQQSPGTVPKREGRKIEEKSSAVCQSGPSRTSVSEQAAGISGSKRRSIENQDGDIDWSERWRRQVERNPRGPSCDR